VGRNREYSIACNSLANKLAQLQIEIPHRICSVPSETNYLADVFSRSFNTSRFLDKQKFALSKIQANKIPPLTEPLIVDEGTLYAYFTNTLNSKDSDIHPRDEPRISTPTPIINLYRLFEECTPEEKYHSAIRLLQGWNDPTIKTAVRLNSMDSCNSCTESDVEQDPLDLLEQNYSALFSQHCEQVIKDTIELQNKDLDSQQRGRIKNTLDENFPKVLRKNMRNSLKTKFINHEAMLINLAALKPDAEAENPSSKLFKKHSQATTPVYYSMLPQVKCQPIVGQTSPGIDIPLQSDLTLEPGESQVTDSGIQFYIPAGFYMQLAPRLSALKFHINLHQGVIDNDFNGTIKLLIRNNNSERTTIPRNTALVQGLIIPVVHSHLNEIGTIHMNSDCQAGMLDSSKMPTPKEIRLTPIPLSPLHTLLAHRTPSVYNIPEINTNVFLPLENQANIDISYRISCMNREYNRKNRTGVNPPLISGRCAQAEILSVTRSLLDKTAHLNALKNERVPPDHRDIYGVKKQIHEDMCKKLAIISVDSIKNQTITATVLAKAQQGDDLLSIIRDNIHSDAIRNKGYVIKNQILYKTYKLPYSAIYKYALCLPDILLPSVIHHIHVMLGHPTYSTMLKTFRTYYHAPAAQQLIKNYVEACSTCELANKYDIKKITPSVARTMKPSRPRQHLYADLLPVHKGKFSYMLFALDAYSQYVYAVPLKDKTSDSVLQGFLSIFGTTGWYENIYLDKEASFVEVAKLLVRLAPMQVHYSIPYCHFQNSSENYIRTFKDTFLKLLNDQENPQENSDWPLLLPTIVQALNRKVISSLGISREQIHYNSTASFYPLVELTQSENAETEAEINNDTLDHFKKLVLQRKKHKKYSKKADVPQYAEKAIVFLRDTIPSVSNTLKGPQRGPFQIMEINERKVKLLELETGQTVHTHIELIRPLDLKEFKTFLNKELDLNVHDQKDIFEDPLHPIPLGKATEMEHPTKEEDEINLEDLFHPQPQNAPNLFSQIPRQNIPPDIGPGNTEAKPAEIPAQAPAAQEIQDEFDPTESNSNNCKENELSFVNSLHAYRDLSKTFRDSLLTRKERLITFFLSKHDQYNKIPPVGEHRESDID
jgi:dUTPase